MGFFDDIEIITTRNGSGAVTGYREDLAPNDIISAALTSYRGVTSVDWYLIGRPAFSSAGGAGPEPIYLTTAQVASFTADNDGGGVRRDGTYILLARLNAGAPNETEVTVALARVSGLTIQTPTGVLNLRKLGGFESMEDTSIPSIEQGWKTQLDGWLELLRQIALSGSSTTTLAQAYAQGSLSGDQTLTLLDAKGGGLLVDGSNVGFTGASALRVNTALGGPVVVDRATGRVGIGTASPSKPVHIANTAPAIRLDRTGGAALDIANVSDELQFSNGGVLLAKMVPTGGIQADLGVGIGTAPATAPALSFGAGSAAAISASGTARFRYNETTGHAEWSENGGPYRPFISSFTAYTTVADAGSALTQRAVLNVARPLVATDNAGSTRTDLSLSIDSTLAVAAGALGRAAITGDVSVPAGSSTAAFRSMSGTAVLARAAGTTGAPADLAATADGQVLQRASGALAWAALPYSALTGTPTLYYQTARSGGLAVTQRPAINADGTVILVDDAGNGWTTLKLPYVGPGDGWWGGTGIAALYLDAQGRVTQVVPQMFLSTIDGIAAGGDLAGPYPNPVIDQKGATTGQVLTWNGSRWNPATPGASGLTQLTGDVTAGPGAGSQVATISNFAVTNAKLSATHTGFSVLGNIANSIGGISDIALSSIGQVLTYDGSTFAFHFLPYSALTGAPTLYYQTAASVGISLTQRSLLNADGSVVMVDDAGNSRTNIGLPNVGPGVGTIGGSGISSITLDAKGRVTAAATAAYLTSAFYQTVVVNGTTATQRNQLGFTSAFTFTDSSSPSRTTVDLSTTGVSAGSYTNASITVGADGRITTAASGSAGSAFYQTVQIGGLAVTQRPTINFGSAFSAVDNSGSARTDVALASHGITFSNIVQIAANSIAMNPTGATGDLQSVSLGSTSGVLQYVNGSPDSFSVYPAAGTRIPFGSGSNGQLTDSANLVFSSNILTVGATATGGGELLVGGSASFTGLTRWWKDSTPSKAWAAGAGTVFPAALSDDWHLQRYTGAAWADVIVASNSSGQVTFSAYGSGIAKLTSGLLGTASSADITGAISWPSGVLAGSGGSLTTVSTWPASGQLAVGTSATTVPIGSADATFSANVLTLGNSANGGGALLIGGSASESAILRVWKDQTPTKGWSFGMSSPSPFSLTDDLHIQRYTGSAWSDVILAANSTGNVLLSAGLSVAGVTASSMVKTDSGHFLTAASNGWGLDYINVAYQTIASGGAGVTQRSKLNFVSGFTVSDNAGTTATDVALNQPVTATYKWSIFSTGGASGNGLSANGSAVVFPGDTGNTSVGTAGGYDQTPGLFNPVAAMASSLTGTPAGSMVPLYPVNTAFSGGKFDVFLWYVGASGTAGQTATLEFSLWYTTDPTTNTAYVRLATRTINVAWNGTGYKGDLGTTSFTASIPSNALLFVALCRTDTNTGVAISPVQFAATANLYK